MCRSIKVLRYSTTAPAEEDVRAAALQFVRKVSGYRAPSRAHAGAFSTAVEEVAQATQKLLNALQASRV
ncbi:MAG: DUF2277 domain-containing protein [Chloroflexi bacterium]|nr:DUF2277 domain-containing protein [Chloroflexota bacterium]